jgi:L-amino acid N-acyltransferase YncA
MFPENVTNVALQEAAGFRIVGRRERLGQLHGVWGDGTNRLKRRCYLVVPREHVSDVGL